MGRAEGAVGRWLDTYVRGTADHSEYLALLGPEVRERLRVGEALSGRVNYGLHLRPGAPPARADADQEASR
jgi:hypothetical protein